MATFEWDPEKDAANRRKHGVGFDEAQQAFFDAKRLIAEDLDRSVAEKRFYCFGRVGGGILTVRFTLAGPQGSNFRRRLLAQGEGDL